jgi:hemolysin
VDLGLTAKKTPADDKGKLAGTDYKPTLKADGEYAHKDNVKQASGISGSQGVNLMVGGATQLTGARISTTEGKVDLGGSKVSSSDLSNLDYGVKAGLDLSGHLDSQPLQAGIDEKG